jgi:hypothetical protein
VPDRMAGAPLKLRRTRDARHRRSAIRDCGPGGRDHGLGRAPRRVLRCEGWSGGGTHRCRSSKWVEGEGAITSPSNGGLRERWLEGTEAMCARRIWGSGGTFGPSERTGVDHRARRGRDLRPTRAVLMVRLARRPLRPRQRPSGRLTAESRFCSTARCSMRSSGVD